MFSGIIETVGTLVAKRSEKENLHLTIHAAFTSELKIDQSIAHNGVCLTVINIENENYTVTAIRETLEKSNLGIVNINDKINLERCLKLGDRLDGHIVQGHVDQTAECINVEEQEGSWKFAFKYDSNSGNVTVEKGSICVNGVSLTVVDSTINSFSVCIIPFTYLHTNFFSIKKGTIVNLEFDILGKYIAKLMVNKL
jgi:riboflavin synthase